AVLLLIWLAVKSSKLDMVSSVSTTDERVSARSFDNEDLSRAALENLWPLPSPSAIFPKTDAQLADYKVWVDTKREWVKTLKDRQVRSAYEDWLDYVAM